MSNIPNNIRKMWEEAAKTKGPMPTKKEIQKAHFPKDKDKYDAKKSNTNKMDIRNTMT